MIGRLRGVLHAREQPSDLICPCDSYTTVLRGKIGQAHELDEYEIRVLAPPFVDAANQVLPLRSTQDFVDDGRKLLFRMLERRQEAQPAITENLRDPVV